MADKLIITKTRKHMAAESETARIAERAAKMNSLINKANKDVVIADIYEQNKFIIEVQNDMLEFLKSGQ